MKKILIIRFSSFGDVVQAINAARELKSTYPNSKITWVTKKMFSEFLDSEPSIDKVVTIEGDFSNSVLSLANYISSQNFDLIYDAHRNLRTFLLKLILIIKLKLSNWVYRPKSRLKRFFLFQFKINLLPNPFFAMDSYIFPIKKYLNGSKSRTFEINYGKVNVDRFDFVGTPYLLFAPSAAWEMKRWPMKYWEELINKLSIKFKIVLVGGSNDQFIKDLYSSSNPNVIDLSGKTTFLETFFLVENASYTLSADTGVIHVAELLRKKGGHLFGPTAFGRTKTKDIKLFEADLPCRPCTKDGSGKCSRKIYQECMALLKPNNVEEDILNRA